MNFITFIKAYKLALFSVYRKTIDWQHLYLGDVIFPDDNLIVFLFSSGHDMQPGDMCISVSYSIDLIARLNGGLNDIAKMTNQALDNEVMAKEYINNNEKINEVGRIITVLDTVMKKLKSIDYDTFENSIIKSLSFDFNNDIVNFEFNDYSISTNGLLVMFGS